MSETGHQPARHYRSQAGNLHLNGANLYDGAEAALPQSISISPAPSTANICLVTISVLDGRGNVIPGVFNFDVWLSDNADGHGLTTTSASGAVAAAAASGTDLVVETAKKATRVQTLATGVYVLSITDTGKTGFYVCAQVPGVGKAVVGAQLVAGNYG